MLPAVPEENPTSTCSTGSPSHHYPTALAGRRAVPVFELRDGEGQGQLWGHHVACPGDAGIRFRQGCSLLVGPQAPTARTLPRTTFGRCRRLPAEPSSWRDPLVMSTSRPPVKRTCSGLGFDP